TKVRPASLGTRVSVRVDGKEVRTFVAATTTQRVPLRTGVGRFDVDVQGLGEGGLAYVDAAPLDGGFILQQKTASELSKGGSLTFHISEEQTTGTVLILQVSTVREGETWVAKYNLFENGDDGVEVQANGSAQGMGTRERKSMLWDIEGGEQAGYSEARIALPAPSSEGWRTLRLWLAGGTAERVWVRAVLLGKEEGGTSERVRLGRGRDSL
ncbi:MAG: hypothetical protein KC416_02415, partial [Myxococcales bacterium]|nr:hypothetical protein [Myxococcales bacterium]